MSFATKSLSFSGTGQWVDEGDVFGFEYTDTWSEVIWFKTTTNGYIVSKMGPPGYGCYISATGNVWLYLNGGAPFSIEVEVVQGGYADGNWHCLGYTYDGSGEAIGIAAYLDGVRMALSASTDNLQSHTIVTATKRGVSGRTDGTAYLFTGNICQSSLYSRVLTDTEMALLYNEGNPLDPKVLESGADLLAHWPLGDGDVYPDAFEGVQAPSEPMTAGFKNPYYTLPNLVAPIEWARGVSIRDMEPFYPGPGGDFCRYSHKFTTDTPFYRMGPINEMAGNAAFSFSVWLKFTVTPIFGSIFTRTTNSYQGGIHFYMYEGPFRLRLWGDGRLDVRTINQAFDDDTWHHVVCTVDGSRYATGAHIWVDGVDESLTVEKAGPINTIDGGPFNIAGYNDTGGGAGYSFIGRMAQPLVYDKALSGAEIAALYNGGDPPDPLLLSSASDIKSYWPMGSGEGETSRHGTMLNMDGSNVVSGPGGVLPQALRFHGTDESINEGNVFRFENDQAFTWVFWFKTSSSDSQTPFGKYDSGVALRGYQAYIDAGVWYWDIMSSGSDRIRVYTDTSGYDDGGWHLCCMSYDASLAASGLKISIDGSPVAVTGDIDALTAAIDTSASLRFGCRGSGETNWWDGDLAGMALYGTDLSAGDITAIWNSGTPVDPTGLVSATYLLGYWPLGNGFYPGDMVGMSAVNIQTDAPYASSLETEKSWTTTGNYDLGAVQNVGTKGKLLLLDWKDKLAAHGWTVIGSSNGTVYEWSGTTGGGSYGGNSTSPYDVWAAVADVVWRSSIAGQGIHSWVCLQSPATAAGQFWLVLDWYTVNEYRINAYVANAKPTLDATPLEVRPAPSNAEWFWLTANGSFFVYHYDAAIRSYFSGCSADGSFVLGRQTTTETDWNALFMFHVLTDTALFPPNMPMAAAGYVKTWSVADQTFNQNFLVYIPVIGEGKASAIETVYGTRTKLLELFTEDSLSGGVQALPVILVTSHGNTAENRGSDYFVIGRVPDLYMSPPAIGRGAMAPSQAPYKYTNVEGYFWIPGSVEPSYT